MRWKQAQRSTAIGAAICHRARAFNPSSGDWEEAAERLQNGADNGGNPWPNTANQDSLHHVFGIFALLLLFFIASV